MKLRIMRALAPLTAPNAVRLVVAEPVQVAKVAFGWIAPPAFTPDHAPLTVLATLLADGKSSRLYRALVVDQRIAVDVDADVDGNALGTLVTIDAQVASGTATESVERALTEQLDILAKVPPTATEVERAQKRLRLQFENEMELLNAHGGDSGRAGLLQRFNHYLGDPGGVTRWQSNVAAVTAADISRVAAQYLGTAHRITVITEPTASKS